MGQAPVTFHLERVLDAPSSEVWARMKRLDTFTYLVRGLLGAPALRGRQDIAEPGAQGSGWLFLFHVIPLHRHTIEVVDVDADAGTIRTHEYGGMVRSWDHTLRVQALEDGRSRYSDTVEIDAGRLTPLVLGFANVIYRYRHRRWPALLRGRDGHSEPAG